METNTTGNRNKFQLWVLVAFQANYAAEKAFLKLTLTFRLGKIETCLLLIGSLTNIKDQ